jgi:hypothetical protein
VLLSFPFPLLESFYVSSPPFRLFSIERFKKFAEKHQQTAQDAAEKHFADDLEFILKREAPRAEGEPDLNKKTASEILWMSEVLLGVSQ